MASQRKCGGFFCGIVCGLIAGSVAALLFAPRPGEETRATLRGQLDALRARVRERVAEILDQGRLAVEEGRLAADELRRDFEATLEAAQRE